MPKNEVKFDGISVNMIIAGTNMMGEQLADIQVVAWKGKRVVENFRYTGPVDGNAFLANLKNDLEV